MKRDNGDNRWSRTRRRLGDSQQTKPKSGRRNKCANDSETSAAADTCVYRRRRHEPTTTAKFHRRLSTQTCPDIDG
ncbi:uncharacterized protein V6R79_019300 [Siganus canaliculatus]